jgi:glutamate-1-semialdehyde 2,1-aminomutase
MTFFANNTAGIELAEEICNAVQCAEQVRYVCTGSEADMYAMRLARAFTGREKILKFEGGYHGMSAEAQMSLAPSRLVNFPLAVPDSPGIPQAVRDAMLVAPFNDIDVRAFHHCRARPRDRRHHRRTVPAHPAAGTRFPSGVARGM